MGKDDNFFITNSLSFRMRGKKIKISFFSRVAFDEAVDELVFIGSFLCKLLHLVGAFWFFLLLVFWYFSSSPVLRLIISSSKKLQSTYKPLSGGSSLLATPTSC